MARRSAVFRREYRPPLRRKWWDPTASPPPELPQTIAGLAGWWDATKITGLSDGATVTTQWTDASGNGRHLTAASGTVTYQTNELNGQPVVQTVAGSLTTASFGPLTQPTTIFYVVRLTTTAGDVSLLDSGPGATDRHLLATFGGAWSMFAGGSGLTGGTTDTSVHVFCAVFNGASSSVRKDGVSVITGNPGTGGLEGLTVGADVVGGGDASAMFAEIIAYDALVSSTDRDALEAYLTAKWVAGGVARDMAGNAPAAADLDGSLAADRPVSAAASAAADLDGSASAARPVDATASAAADLDGTATFARGLAASASTAAEATGALDVDTGLTEVAGNAPAAADLDGSLTVAYTLAGAGTAAADLDGSLSTERPLAAAGSAAADLDGSASAARPLNATAAAAGAATGTAATARPLAATSVSAASGATGTLETFSETLLDGNASAAADLDGSLTVAYTLAATANAASGATGSMAVAKTFAATAPAAADLDGSLARARPLAATATAAAGVEGLLARTELFAAVLTAAAGATAELSTTRVPPPRWVEGDASSSGQVEGDAAGSGQTEGVLVGAGIVEGSASV
jgi:hypothetical protein